MTAELVICVDENDREVGVVEKLLAHRSATLHRAVSVMLVDQSGRLLLQRRALAKYHSAGLWTNTCCGHPRPGETSLHAATRRLRQEMGISCELWEAGRLHYRAELADGLVEHELDHVFVSRWSGEPLPDPAEVDGWRWATLPEVRAELRGDRARFTAWFEHVLDRAIAHPMIGSLALARA